MVKRYLYDPIDLKEFLKIVHNVCNTVIQISI